VRYSERVMPDGKTHDKITLIGAALSVPAWLLLAPPEWRTDYTACGTLVAATLFSGLMLSPDLDLDSSIYRRWGPIRFVWWPYQKLIPHRSTLSHSLLLGPLLRVLYFLVVGFLLLRVGTWCLRFFIPIDRNALSREYVDLLYSLPIRYPHAFYAAIIGLIFGAAMHIGADALVTRLKTTFGHRRKRRH